MHAVIVPIVRTNDAVGAALVEAAVGRVEAEARDLGVRIRVDRREGIRPGEKFAHWELRGVPLRIVAGAKDLAEGVLTVVRRVDGDERRIAVEGLARELPTLLDEAQAAIHGRAHALLAERSREVSTLDELRGAFEVEPVFANAPFCNSADCEDRVKAAVHGISVRNLRADRRAEGAPCLVCGTPADHVALIAKAY